MFTIQLIYFVRREDIIKLGHLPQLHTLILSDNPLLNISLASSCHGSLPTPSQQDEQPRCIGEATAPSVKKDDGDDAVFIEENKSQDQVTDLEDMDEACASSEKCDSLDQNQSDPKSGTVPSINKDDSNDAVFDDGNKTQDQVTDLQDMDEACAASENCDNLDQNQSDLKLDTVQTNTSSSDSGKEEQCEDSISDNVQVGIGAQAADPEDTGDDAINMEEGEQDSGEDEDIIKTFQALSVLCVSNTQLHTWNDIEALRTFPKLTSLKIRVRLS